MEIWKIWGRRRFTKVSLSRKTMKVEAHWSVLKRLYLLPFNRPRVDLLLYVISSKPIPKFIAGLDDFQSGRRKPNWWKQFRKNWVGAFRQNHVGSTKQISTCLLVLVQPGPGVNTLCANISYLRTAHSTWTKILIAAHH